MDPEEQFNHEVWSVLEAIRVLQLLPTTKSFEQVELEHYIPSKNIPSHIVSLLLKKLITDGVLVKADRAFFQELPDGSSRAGRTDVFSVNKERYNEARKVTYDLLVNKPQQLDVQHFKETVQAILVDLFNIVGANNDGSGKLIELWEPELQKKVQALHPTLSIEKVHVRATMIELERQGKITLHTKPNDIFEQHFRVALPLQHQTNVSASRPESADANFVEKEKVKATAIVIPTDHRLFRDKWLTVKRVLDVIYKKLPPLSPSSKLPFNADFSALPQHYVEDVLKFLLEKKLTGYVDPEEGGPVTTTTYYRRYLTGEGMLIIDREGFEQYRGEVSALYAFIEGDGKKRFPTAYNVVKMKTAQQMKAEALRKALNEPPKELGVNNSGGGGLLHQGKHFPPRRVFFDEQNGHLSLDGKRIYTAGLNSPEFHFLVFLWKNWEKQSPYRDIHSFVRGKMGKKGNDSSQNSCAKMKNSIKKKCKMIDEIITIPTVRHFMMADPNTTTSGNEDIPWRA